MSTVPDDLLYSAEHVWVQINGFRARIGITDFAQATLGEIVFVKLPDIGQMFTAGTSLGELESLKSTSDVYAPIAGTIVACNVLAREHPELINGDPYGDGWLCEFEVAGTLQTPLLNATDYRTKVSDD